MFDPRLLVGYDSSDDACVYSVSDDVAVIETVDFFTPIVDDPYLFGQIAAANALSDVYAMGGVPKLAMNLLCVPSCLPLDTVRAILEGGHDKAVEAGCVIAGGHTIQDDEPKYGLCVTGFVHPQHILKNIGAQPGDVLVLTKALGVGVITTALKAALADDSARDAAYASMAALNAKAAQAVREVSRGRILKVIIECCLLTEEEKRMLCRIVSDSGADYIKTSTGFSTGGATADDVRLLRTCCPPHVKVKAAGGIASLADAEEFIRLGADRLGTSRIVKIAMAQEQQAAEAAAAPQQPEAAAQPETPAQPQAPEQQDTTY